MLNSRQPLPTPVFNSLTVPKSLANNAQFEIKFVLGKGPTTLVTEYGAASQ